MSRGLGSALLLVAVLVACNARRFRKRPSWQAPARSSFVAGVPLALWLVCAAACARAAELDIEALPSLDGTGKVGARIAGQVQIWGVLRLAGGVAVLPGAVITDLTPALRIGDDSEFWAQLGAGPAYSSSNVIDTHLEATRFLFHDELTAGYGPFYLGFTHYSNAYIKTPNMGSNFLTIGVKISLP